VDATGSPLGPWENFYVIIGSSAGALIGLQFVVIALIAETRRPSTSGEIDVMDATTAAFGTPTIIHFAAVLLVSLILSAPWPSLSGAALALGISGCAGLGYVGVVIRRARRQTGYTLVMEDWVWHTALPLIAYATLAAAAPTLGRRVLPSLFAVAGAALLLLFIGIHNAWDAVTYIAVQRPQPSSNAEQAR
jgi:hypothetical protein